MPSTVSNTGSVPRSEHEITPRPARNILVTAVNYVYIAGVLLLVTYYLFFQMDTLEREECVWKTFKIHYINFLSWYIGLFGSSTSLILLTPRSKNRILLVSATIITGLSALQWLCLHSVEIQNDDYTYRVIYWYALTGVLWCSFLLAIRYTMSPFASKALPAMPVQPTESEPDTAISAASTEPEPVASDLGASMKSMAATDYEATNKV